MSWLSFPPRPTPSTAKRLHRKTQGAPGRPWALRWNPVGMRPWSNNSLLQLLVQPVEGLVLHGDRETMRLVVEAAAELVLGAGFRVDRLDFLDGLFHGRQRKEG